MSVISDVFVDHLYGIAVSEIPQEVVSQAELCILDFRGCALAGAAIIRERAESFLDSVAAQGGNASVIGFDRKTTVHNAAFLDAMCAHSTELDDGHRFGMIHLGASVIAALLPVAEQENLSHDSVVRGVVAGYDAAVRLAMAMQPSHKVRGYHTSGTCGTVGAAVAVAVAMGLSRDGLKSAVAAAAASAAGLLEMQEDSSEMKPYNLAQAAICGITAAYAAKAGFLGPDDPIGGRRGMLAVMSENPRTEFLTDFSAYPYEIMRIYRKLYAACRHCHPAIEAAIELKCRYGICPEDIGHIRVRTYKLAVAGHDHKDIKGIPSAKLSMPFSVALALVRGSAGYADFNPGNVSDPYILSLMDRVEICVDDVITSWCPDKRAAAVEIGMKCGDVYSCEVDYPKGEPENPLTIDEINAKF